MHVESVQGTCYLGIKTSCARDGAVTRELSVIALYRKKSGGGGGALMTCLKNNISENDDVECGHLHSVCIHL